MKNLNDYSKKIIAAYEKNIFFLSTYEIGHFFMRAYKVTGNKKYIQPLSQFIYIYRPLKTNKVLNIIKNNRFSYRAPENLFKVANLRLKERLDYYSKNSKVKFYLDLLQYFIYLEKFSLKEEIFRKDYPKIISSLKKEDFRKLFFSIDAMNTNASYIFNSLFVLKNLGVCDLTSEAIDFYKNIYLSKNSTPTAKLSQKDFISLIYGLTHIVIAASNYYEHFVRNDFWIIEFFKKNLDRILKETTFDVIAEVGLCIKLFQKEKEFEKEYKKILSYLIQDFPFEKLQSTDFIIKKEHTCSILMLLFSQKNTFYKGPNLLQSEVFVKYNNL